ncbi:hypothetical protein J4Q44_G00027390 [Coregonus suidteri]|uniref:Uncharacterized protein n=1 Tax=Coregonus suidteri TaxID=861788 RepID=A0AAN8R8M3_9TELE
MRDNPDSPGSREYCSGAAPEKAAEGCDNYLQYPHSDPDPDRLLLRGMGCRQKPLGRNAQPG